MSRMGISTFWGRITVLIAVCGWALSAQAKYAGGSGTEAEPFRISGVSDWQELMATPADWASHFVLTGDLDLEGIPLSPLGVSYSAPFTGVFDGNDYVIRNADVNMPASNYVGLFGYLGTDGEIKNLGAEEASIFGQNNVGGLVGVNAGTITDCYSTGFVMGYEAIGGLVGNNDFGTMTNCYSTGVVQGTGCLGGLVGENYGTITNCYSTSIIHGWEMSFCFHVGGLVGENYGTITNCYSTDSFIVLALEAGGLVGVNHGTITKCYSIGYIYEADYGGLVGSGDPNLVTASFWNKDYGYTTSAGGMGKTTAEMKTMSTFTDAGWDFVSIWKIYEGVDYPKFLWQPPGSLHLIKPNGDEDLVGEAPFTITWASISSISDVLIELSTDNGQSWSSIGTVANKGSYNWLVPVVDSNQCLVRISDVLDPSVSDTSDLVFSIESARYSGGTGEPNNPYRIATPEDLSEIATHPEDWDTHFVLTADIDLNDVLIIPIGNSATHFTGVFDGNDYVIRNADVNMPGGYYVGLFGYLGTGAQVRNLGVEDASISGYSYTGGLVGNNRGTISNCYSTGLVSGGSYVGGLVGENGGSITNCYSTASVGGSSYVAGLVGYNSGTINNCYSTGSVSGDGGVGGLVGSGYGGNFTACFWDIENSGQLGSSGGKGLTTEEMKSLIIYCNAGWGGKGWVIEDGLHYPRLAWEATAGVPIPEPEPVPLLGEGTEQSPYQIWTTEDFARLSWHILILDKHIELKADLDLAGIALYPIGDLGGFIGVFDGNGYVIRNADVNMPGSDYVGLFGCVGTGGQLRNLGVEDISIFGSNYTGGLVGYNFYGTISNCYSTGSVGGTWYCAGGLVGFNDGPVSNCYSTGSVSGDSYVGGLVGSNGGTISNCHSACLVTAAWYLVGGLVGNNGGTVTNCYSTGSVTGNGDVGGLVGSNGGTINNCYSTGSVSGTRSSVGGLAGENYSGTINNCYSTGSVTGTDRVGGLVGRNGYYYFSCDPEGGCWEENHPGWIYKCYSTGKVSGGFEVGGLVGVHGAGEVGDSCWDTDSSEQSTSAGGTPKTTPEMKTQSTFTSAGWDFIGETANGTEDIWAMCEGTNYPRFVYQIPQGDIVCPDGVNSVDYSLLARYWHETDCAALDDCDGADIDLSGAVDFADVAAVAESWLRDG